MKLDDLHRENLLSVLEEFGIAGLDAAAIERFNRAWHRLKPWPDVVEGLERLKRKFVLATLSNGNVALMVNLAKYAGLSWDVILGAEIARAYKPDAAAYDRAADLLDLAPGACMMVAAHPSDLRAAAGRGFRTAFVPRPAEHGPRGAGEDAGGEEFDIVAKDFCDLAARLGC